MVLLILAVKLGGSIIFQSSDQFQVNLQLLMRPKYNLLICILFILPTFGQSQFAPAAGKPGSTAIKHDSSCFINWASQSFIKPGFMDISNPDSGLAAVGDALSATDKALLNGVVSLGDGGQVVLKFPAAIIDGPGWDFAVFENSFLDTFLELAFVEVSTDGKRYVRFASESLTDTTAQVASFGYLKPENINNLAGKYRAGYGTPFDLSELKDSAGINVNDINFVRITDVVGCMNPKYAGRDSRGRKINDPWPTRFPSSGFDLDAVGVIHQHNSSVPNISENKFTFYPNPSGHSVVIQSEINQTIFVLNISGNLIESYSLIPGENRIDFNLPNGCYLLQNEYGVKPQILMIINP
jgi:hypothetical protein